MGVLDANRFKGVRKPLLEAETMPPECYTSPEFYKLELEKIFRKCWNVVGREDFAKSPGDYFVLTLAGVPAFVVRGEDGKLRCFINSCRHRGAQLVVSDGNCRRITCPYHAWTYGLDGRLVGPNGMKDTSNFDPKEFGLVEVKLATWQGFVFINFDPGSEGLSSYLGELTEYVESYGLTDMVTKKRQEFKIRGNWKSYVENSQEIFHLPTIHRNTFGSLKADFTHTVGKPGNFTIQGTRLAVPETRAAGKGPAFEKIPTLRGPAAEGAQVILIYPCTILICDLDFMWYRQMEPDGPDTIHYKAAFCFPKASAERADFDDIADSYYQRIAAVMAEDNFTAEIQFQGLHQPWSLPGRFSSKEPLVHEIDNWILDRMFGSERVSTR